MNELKLTMGFPLMTDNIERYCNLFRDVFRILVYDDKGTNLTVYYSNNISVSLSIEPNAFSGGGICGIETAIGNMRLVLIEIMLFRNTNMGKYSITKTFLDGKIICTAEFDKKKEGK